MEEKDLQLLEESKLYVSSTGKWMKFFAVLGCIGIAFLVLCTFFMMVVGAYIPMFSGVMSLRWFSLIYIVLAVIYVWPIIYMFRASAAAKLAVESNDNIQMAEFLKNNKSFWKFCGILTIVVLCIYVVAIIGIIIAAIATGMPMM
ncbi:MAG: hypothetical protein J6P65_01840 [Bacteroidales bacterium]|nr:hypothetical protein [Bacteroidales bacterium]